MNQPDKPGQWRVRHKSGEWHNAEVRETECGLEARIEGCCPVWHFVEWISMNSWEEWQQDTFPGLAARPAIMTAGGTQCSAQLEGQQ